MGVIAALVIHLSFIIFFNLQMAEINAENKVQIKCRERNRLITNDRTDLYVLVDATLEQKLILRCDYCNENDNGRPKNWYKIDKLGLSEPHPVKLTMENDLSRNHIHVNEEHSLVIKNVSQNDMGLYYCIGYEEHNIEDKHNYLVDLIIVNQSNSTAIEKGNISDWKQYYDDYLAPINMLFKESEGLEFKEVRELLNLDMELETEWESWGPCEVCGRPQGEGISKKKGYCRIKLSQRTSKLKFENKLDEIGTFLTTATSISCKSAKLRKKFPLISNFTSIIPDFIQVQQCEGICNPDAEGENRGWKVGKTKSFKYRKSIVLAEGSHFTIVCPEATLDNTVIWRKSNKILKSGTAIEPSNSNEEARVLVDTFNTLYLVKVTESEAGNYTCQVDDIKMQMLIVHVVSKSKILTAAFLRHLMYLGFIVSLTTTCYCAGLVVSWNRRYTFKNYEQLKYEQHKRNKREHVAEFESLL